MGETSMLLPIEVLDKYFELQNTLVKLEKHEDMFKLIQEHQNVFDKVFSVIKQKAEDNDFQVHYQPHIQNGKCIGAEALFRMSIGDKRLNPMAVFALASYYGYERTLTGKVFKQILPDTVKFADNISPDFRVSFNVNPTLFNKGFCDDLLKYSGMFNFRINQDRSKPIDIKNNLAVELVETSSLEQVKKEDMKYLQYNDFLIMLDDFGSGHANKEIATKLPFDVIKIDGKIIRDIQTNDVHKNLVQSLLQEKNPDTLTIAEKVDTKELVDYVTNLGIDIIQGNYYSEAVNCDEFLNKYSNNLQKQDEIAD